MTAISVIMPCYNQAYHLRRVLQAYENQSTAEPFELIAVNDASPDETKTILANFRTDRFQFRFFNQEKNQGPAAARNMGIQNAQSPLIVFVGDDILPEKTFIQEHLEAHRRRPETEAAILGHVTWPADMPINSLMKHIDGMGAEQFSYFYFKDQTEYDYRHLYTANISLKKELLLRVDRWFDTEFPFAAYEDVELSYRLAQKGMRIYYDARPIGYHYHYHHIWSFSERQYRAGLMAIVLGKKHPVLRKTVLGKNWLPHLSFLGVKSIFRPASASQAGNIEKTMMLLASEFEWAPDQVSDWLYLQLLQYFYYKGIVAGAFSRTFLHSRVLHSYMYFSLASIINKLKIEYLIRQLPFPSIK